MELSIVKGKPDDFFNQATAIASSGDSQRKLKSDQKSKALYLRTDDDVNNAYASAWLHRFHPRAFEAFDGFDNPVIDPLTPVVMGNAGRKMGDRLGKYGAPWVRHERGGVDFMGSLAIHPQTGDVTVIVGCQLVMEHLAFVYAMKNDIFHKPAIRFLTGARGYGVVVSHEVGRGSAFIRDQVTSFDVSYPDEQRNLIVDAIRRVQSGVNVFVAIPKSLTSYKVLVHAHQIRYLDGNGLSPKDFLWTKANIAGSTDEVLDNIVDSVLSLMVEKMNIGQANPFQNMMFKAA